MCVSDGTYIQHPRLHVRSGHSVSKQSTLDRVDEKADCLATTEVTQETSQPYACRC